jgi:hypothetical protein
MRISLGLHHEEKNRMTHRRLGIHVAVLLLCLPLATATAQRPEDCDYAACALRLRYSLFSIRLVQGQDQQRVASLGLFPPTVALFAERSDTAAQHYASFRRRHTSGALLTLAGTIAATAGLLAYDSDDDLGVTLVIGGGFLGIGGAIQATRAREQLSQAVWWYNRTLAAAP